MSECVVKDNGAHMSCTKSKLLNDGLDRGLYRGLV